jgi:excinuclease UvrABC helicase subunit UvrB
MVARFGRISAFEPRGDQPKAIQELMSGLERDQAGETAKQYPALH